MKVRVISAIALGLLIAVGCGGRDFEAENRELRDELAQARSEHEATSTRLQRIEAENQEMLSRLSELGSNVDDLSEARALLERQLAEARAREEAQASRLNAFRGLIDQFRQLIDSGQLRVRIVRGKMVVELPEGILFDSARSDLKDDGETTLTRVAEVLGQIENREFLVAGHTDNIPIRSRRFPSNWELSAARGVVVARFLSENGVPANRLAAAGYADTQPVGSNETEEGRAQNRRIEIILMPNLDELPDMSSLEAELEN